MTPRPRKASDADVFAAAGRVMARLGPAQLTLADIAAEAGVTAGALVQRFGGKRALLVAFTARAADDMRAHFTALRRAHPTPLAALRAYADAFARMGESPGTLANHLAYLQLDITDPELRANTCAQADVADDALRALLADAIAAGELAPDTDAAALTRLVQALLGGALMTWALRQQGTADRWIREHLDLLLAPYARD